MTDEAALSQKLSEPASALAGASRRLFIPITRQTLPRVTDKYPFLYLERGRLEIDDSSLKWIDADGNRVRLVFPTPVGVFPKLTLAPF